MQAAARRACAACAGSMRQLTKAMPSVHAGSSRPLCLPGGQARQLWTLPDQCRERLQHQAGVSAWRMPRRALTTAAAATAAPARKRGKKHVRPGTAPGPMPLDVPPDKPVIILGIDPDAGGAIVTLEWGATAARSDDGLPCSLADASLQIFDMPMETIALEKRSRRQADARAISDLLHELLPTLAAKATVHCVLEQPVPNALNGKFSWFQSGYAYGVWNGVLATYSMRKQVIAATRWKRDMGLYGKGKEGSRQLALALFPQAAQQLKRKKDHGRAEALVLAAWASGIELPEAAFESAQAAIDAAEGVTSVVEPLPAEEEAELLQPVPQQA